MTLNHPMLRRPGLATFICLGFAIASSALAHPGSGIAVAEDRSIYFVDTGAGVLRIDASGPPSAVADAPAFHWMALDRSNRWRSARLPTYPLGEFKSAGDSSALILSSDVPVAISDGDLVYAQPRDDKRLEIIRWTLTGDRNIVTTLPAETEDGPLQWLNGLAAGPARTLFFAENSSIRSIAADGSLSTIATGITVPDCVHPPGYEDHKGPDLRGLDVHADGHIFAAATGCSALVSVTPEGNVSVVLRTESPWSPTAVAVSGDVLYVLEYLHKATEDRRAWTPRVRKIAPDGTTEIIAAITR